MNAISAREAAGFATHARRIAVVASLTKSLTNFRLELLKAMIAQGHAVTAFAPEDDNDVIAALRRIGVPFVRIPMSRASLSPISDIRTFLALWRRLHELSPDTFLAYTMKPIIFGGLAARLAGVRHRFALITGLGYVFSDATRQWPLSLVRRVSILLYRFALRGAERIFVYNEADADDVRRNRMISDVSLITRVPGSGVDTQHFAYSEPLDGPPTFLLIARLLRDKGITEYVEALRELRLRFPIVRAELLGPFDPNPSSIHKKQIDDWVQEGLFHYLGEVNDVRPILARSSVLVLPTYYREGIPRTILEAMAVGRPIITTDLPGCRETVLEGENGYLVPPRNANSLARAMEAFLKDPTLVKRMGRKSREIVCGTFDVHTVNRLILQEMNLLRSQP